MHYHTCTWIDSTTYKTGLSSTKGQFDYHSVDHPKKTKSQVTVHSSGKESAVSTQQHVVPKLVTSKQQILQSYSDVFDGI